MDEYDQALTPACQRATCTEAGVVTGSVQPRAFPCEKDDLNPLKSDEATGTYPGGIQQWDGRCNPADDGQTHWPSISYETIDDILKCLRLSDDERAAVAREVPRELVRCWPVIIKTVTLLASLPAIQMKATTHFKRRQGIRHSAEDLAGTVIEKIVERLFGGPRGNPGAWIWAIICRVGSDHWRSVAREEKHFGKRLVSAHIQSYSDATYDIGVAAERFLGNLPTMEGEIAESLLKGDSVAAITQRTGLSESAIRQMFKKLNVHRGRSRRGVNDP